jgi:DNA gyrase/topoisomerase IV subunit B
MFGSREEETQVLPGYRDGKLGLYQSTWVPCLWTMFREIIDNALDELRKYGYGDTVRIEFDPATLVCSVSDNGRGAPIREIPTLGKGPAASILLGEAMAGRNFKDQGDGAGMNGVGASAVNFTSEWFEIEVDRDGTQDKDGVKKLTQRWDENVKGGKDFHKTKGPHVIRGSKTRSGTTVRYRPSEKIYPVRTLPMEFVRDRIWDIAVVNPQFKIFLNGERFLPQPGTDAVMSTYFPGRTANVADISVDGFKTKFYIAPKFSEAESVLAIVNNIPLFNGGTHIDAFKTLFVGTVLEELERKTKKEELKFTRDMVLQGTLIYGVTFMESPKFDGQSKVRLTTNVSKAVKDGYLASDITSLMRRNPEWVDSMIELARAKTNKSDADKVRKMQREMKRSRVAKLDDASHRNRAECILFVMEGDSAVGLLSDEREAIHGILPLRGKVMNVRQHKPVEVIESPGLSDLMTALGLQIGEPAIRRRLRFGSVYIATDEDKDGDNITALLTNFFYQYWPELFDPENPFLYRFNTPYLILTRGKEVKYIYAHDYDEYQKSPDTYKGWSVLRAKGLGALNATAWKHVLDEPVLIPLVEDPKLKDTLSMIFDEDRVEDRKVWLEKGIK